IVAAHRIPRLEFHFEQRHLEGGYCVGTDSGPVERQGREARPARLGAGNIEVPGGKSTAALERLGASALDLGRYRDRALQVGGFCPRKLLVPPGELHFPAIQREPPLPFFRPCCRTFRNKPDLQRLPKRAGRSQGAFELVSASVRGGAQSFDVELPSLDAARCIAVMELPIDDSDAPVSQRPIKHLAPLEAGALAARQR